MRSSPDPPLEVGIAFSQESIYALGLKVWSAFQQMKEMVKDVLGRKGEHKQGLKVQAWWTYIHYQT